MTNRPVFHSRFFIIMLAKPVCLLAFPFLEQFGMMVSSVADPYPTIKSHITRSKYNKLNRYFCEKFTFFKIKPANSEKGGVGGRG